MFLKPARLPSGEFRLGWQQTVTTPYFLLKTKENHKTKNRIGVVVSASTTKGAAKRNFLKRQAKAVLWTAHGTGTGRDILLVFSPKASVLKRKQFRMLLLETIGKIKNTKK